MHPNSNKDRRRSQRTYVAAVATLFDGDLRVGDYFVHDLSAGGALLVGGPALVAGRTCRVLLQVAGLGHLRLQAEVAHAARSAQGTVTLGVRFQQLSSQVRDGLQQLVLQELERSAMPAVLVVDTNLHRLSALAESLAALGERPLLASTPLEVIHWLSTDETEVGSVFVGNATPGDQGGALLSFIRDEYPQLRCFQVEDAPDEERLRELLDSLNDPIARRPASPHSNLPHAGG